MRAWAKRRKGGDYRTEALSRYGVGREPSSINVYLSIIGRKIMPFIRHHCFGEDDQFKVTDLIAFGTKRWKRLKEAMVIECNQEVGVSPALKKATLNGWSVLFRAISLAARDHVDVIGESGVREVEDWYERLCRDIGPGVTLMGAAATKAREERREEAEEEGYIPADVAIQRWLGSEERASLMLKLRNLAGKIRRKEPLNITSTTYSDLRELVITELAAYSVVRIGAWVKMTNRAFVRSKPAWQYNTMETRPVTTPPTNACHHQKIAKTSSAMSGLDKKGNPCCDDAVPPTCFIAVKDQDKGGKSDGSMIFSHEAFQLVLDLLLVRDSFFSNTLPEVFAKLDGNSAIFLSSTGKEPGLTSSFRLKIFNKAVIGREGEIVITSKALRTFNTTYLNEHPDSKVRAARGAATGNTDRVFEEHYNLTRRARIMDALLASLRRHQNQTDQPQALPMSQEEHDRRREKDNAAIKEANLAVLLLPDGVDMTSRQRPVPIHLRHQFQQELTRLSPGLWERAGTGRGVGLSEMAWVKEILQFVGRMDANILRDLIVQQYRGEENISKRQWSGLQSHLASMEQERKAGTQVNRSSSICNF